MWKVKKNFGKFGITIRQFVFLFLIAFFLFLIIQWNSLNNTKELSEKQVVDDAYTMVVKANNYFDVYLDTIRSILFIISNRTDLFNISSEQETKDFLSSFIEQNTSMIKNIYIIRNDGKIISSRETLMGILGNPDLPEVIKNTFENPRGMYWSEPYYNSISGKTFAVTMPVRDKTGKMLGIVAMEASLDYIYNKISLWLKASDQAFIVSSRENEPIIFDDYNSLLAYEKGAYPIKIEQTFLNLIAVDEREKKVVNYGDKSLIVIKSGDNVLGWNLTVLMDRKQITGMMERMYQNFYINMAIWIIVIIIGSFMLSFYFSKPIRRFAAKMDTVRNLDHFEPMEVKREDEIGRLALSYNHMMKRINLLLVEIKEAESKKKAYELKMLQSQIGPHFLYNTLSCIGSLARQERIDEVGEAIKALVALLSFSFDRHTEFVNLDEEMRGLEAYIKIQKIRYRNIFLFETDIADEVRNCAILKLTLQPLVENAIFHGLSPKKEKGYIRIKAWMKDDRVIITVRDNGVGMDKEICKRILFANDGNKLHDRFSSIGIANVNERLKINYGRKFGLRIGSRVNIGTIVRVCIPVQNEKNIN